MRKIAVYGKGGIGKSTLTSNLAAALAALGKKVIQIGCEPKADSTINLLGGKPLQSVMGYVREFDEEPASLETVSARGFGGVLCIETGGPTPGLGCAGRGIIATFNLLEDLELFEREQPDVVLYEESLDQATIIGAVDAIRRADLLIVAGTSLTVYPAAAFLDEYPGNRLVLINKTATPRDDIANLTLHESLGEVFSRL